MKRIVIAEDEGEYVTQIGDWLRKAGYSVVEIPKVFTPKKSPIQRVKARLAMMKTIEADLVILGDLHVGTSRIIDELVGRGQLTITTWSNRSYFETPYVRRTATRDEFLQKVAQVLNPQPNE